MKRLGKQADANTLCVLHASDANMSRTGYFQEYIAFGNWVDSCDGPSIRFHGGSPFSGRLDNAPVMCFNIYGNCKIVPAMWMNENNCPNVYDDKFINQITTFIQINLPILYLVYNRFLDKEDALAYFKGTIDFKNLLKNSTPITAVRTISSIVSSFIAIIIPIRNMKQRLPRLVKSFFVTQPNSPIAPKVKLVAKKVLAIEFMENARKIHDNAMPLRIA